MTPTATVNASLALGANRFNVLSDPPLLVAYWVVNGGQVDIRIYNVADICIRHLVSANMGLGAYAANWDGKDDNGNPVYSGLYLVAITEPGRIEIKKVVAVNQ
jgi:flagellar hook assembly protein FlgD